MEVILGGVDIDAETAERWGYLNRALPPEELRSHVTELALRIASFPPAAVALAKESVNNADTLPLLEGLMEERYLFQKLLRTDEAMPAMMRLNRITGDSIGSVMRRNRVTGPMRSISAASISDLGMPCSPAR